MSLPYHRIDWDLVAEVRKLQAQMRELQEQVKELHRLVSREVS